MAAKTPTELIKIKPYYNNYFTLEGDDSDFKVNAVSIERTFWEKVLILHAEANRPLQKKMPMRYFRHYYDVVMIYKSSYFNKVLDNLDLFEKVKQFKSKYYRNSWAKIDECSLSKLKLIPGKDRIVELRKDYESMKDMFFDGTPKFEDILSDLKDLETLFNNIGA